MLAHRRRFLKFLAGSPLLAGPLAKSTAPETKAVKALSELRFILRTLEGGPLAETETVENLSTGANRFNDEGMPRGPLAAAMRRNRGDS